MLIVLFSEATPFEDNVSTILSWIVDIWINQGQCYQQRPKAEAVNTYRAFDYSRSQKTSYPVFSIYMVLLILLSYLFEAKSGSNSEVSADSLDDYMSSLGTTMDKTSRSQIRRKVFDLKKVLFNYQKSSFKCPSQIIRGIKLLTLPLSLMLPSTPPYFVNDRQYYTLHAD